MSLIQRAHDAGSPALGFDGLARLPGSVFTPAADILLPTIRRSLS